MAWTTPGTAAAGDVLTAAFWNTQVRDNLTELQPAALEWQTWTPTWSNVTIGNGTVVARYLQIGKYVRAHLRFTLGSTSAISTNPGITGGLPARKNITDTNGQALFIQAAGLGFRYIGLISGVDQDANTWRFVGILVNATIASFSQLSSTNPMTWTTNDTLVANWDYEAA